MKELEAKIKHEVFLRVQRAECIIQPCPDPPKNCMDCLIEHILAAVKETHVELAKNQEAPENQMACAPNDDWEASQRAMLTPVQDAAGRWTRFAKIYYEKPEGGK